MGTDPLIRKLEQFTMLTEDEKRQIRDSARDFRTYDRHRDIIREGDKPDKVHLVLEGWLARYKLLPGGQQAILAFLIPGDLCDVQVSLLGEMDHSIKSLSTCSIALIPRQTVAAMIRDSERLGRAMWWSTLLDEAILREWLVTLGHRPAVQRVAHLVCEMLLRARAVGLTEDDSFELPLTQDELGEVMGLSTVHINRVLQELRGHGFIATERRRMIVHDPDGLMSFSDFNPNYLHQVNSRAPLARAGSG